MDPWQANAAIWKQHIEPKRSKGYKFASPAMLSRPNGQKWTPDFLAACDGCYVRRRFVVIDGMLVCLDVGLAGVWR